MQEKYAITSIDEGEVSKIYISEFLGYSVDRI
jgi:hypothetical protein